MIRMEVLVYTGASITYQQIRDTYVNEISCNSLDFVEWRKSALFGCSSCATLFKRDFLLENNLFFRENVWFEDTDWVQKAMYYAGNIDFIDFAYYAYRQSLNSTTRGYSVAAFEDNVEGLIETFRFFQERFPVESPFWQTLNESLFII